MQLKQRNKKKPSKIAKQQARFQMKYEEFSKLPLYDEKNEDGTIKVRGLKTISMNDKMSSTDKTALLYAVDNMAKNQMLALQAKEQADKLNEEMGLENEPDRDEEGTTIPGE